MAKTVRRAIGLMSGTSMDGVDCALIETDGGDRLDFGPTGFSPYTEADRALLRRALADAVTLQDRAARPGALAEAERMITQRHIEAVERFLAEHRIDRGGVDVVGFHGQTVIHRPERGLTVQIGDGPALARALGLDVVCDLRGADMAAGGQGAPLAPVYHQALVRAGAIGGPVLVVNIGGVGNVTFVAPGRDPVACDTGPGNALIDDLMAARTGEAYDHAGATAARGAVDAEVLERLMAHSFFEEMPPKSLDRNAFSLEPVAALSTEDAAATLTAFTAATIAGIVSKLPGAPAAVVICGGGARNPTLQAELARRFACPVTTADDRGWSGDAVEAQAFAYMAVRSLEGLPLTFPTTTGVPRPLTGGVLCPAPAAGLLKAAS